MRFTIVGGLLLTASLGCTAAVAQPTWSVSDDFSATLNPNGPWSYGYVIGDIAAPAEPWQAFDARGTFGAYSFHYLSGTGLPSIGQANEANDFGVPIGGVILHPGNTFALRSHAAVVRWTAPAAGSYRIDGRFVTVDPRGPQVSLAVVADGSLAWTTTASGTGASRSFSLSQALDAGDSVWFAVSNAGAFGDRQWSQLEAEVSLVPEPATLAMLLAGLSVAGIAARRSTRR